MTDIVPRLLFYAYATTRPPTFEVGNTATVTLEFRDRDTDEPVAVTGAAARVFAPGGAEIVPAPVLTLVSAGIYTFTVSFAAFVGTWVVEGSCTGPEAAVVRREVAVRQTLPSGTVVTVTPPAISAVGRSMVLDEATALTFQTHQNATLILTGAAHQISLDWDDTGSEFSCVLVNATEYDVTPLLTGFTEGVVRNGSGGTAVAVGGTASLFCQEIGADLVAYLVGEVA